MEQSWGFILGAPLQHRVLCSQTGKDWAEPSERPNLRAGRHQFFRRKHESTEAVGGGGPPPKDAAEPGGDINDRLA